MKLLRFGDPGKEKPGILLNNEIVDLSSFGEDYDEHFFETDGINRLSQWLSQNTNLPKVKSGTRIGVPFKRPSKIICIGLNYTKHAFETNMPLPTEPIIFFKSTSAVIAKQVKIRKEYSDFIIQMLSDFNWEVDYSVEKALEKIRQEHLLWKSKNGIIESIESNEEFEKRLHYEIVQSKNIIEQELRKKVEFLCWPHGENNDFVHQYALNNGYLATTTGSKQNIKPSGNRISVRTSIGIVNNSLFLTNLKTFYRMSLAGGNPSMKLLQNIVQKIK